MDRPLTVSSLDLGPVTLRFQTLEVGLGVTGVPDYSIHVLTPWTEGRPTETRGVIVTPSPTPHTTRVLPIYHQGPTRFVIHSYFLKDTERLKFQTRTG